MYTNTRMYKTWYSYDKYNFAYEFNRIERYNAFSQKWINDYFNGNIEFVNKTDWEITDIPDLNDYNRIKNNLNTLFYYYQGRKPLSINTQINQIFDYNRANELEDVLKSNMKSLGEKQFFNMKKCGIIICGNSLNLGGIK